MNYLTFDIEDWFHLLDVDYLENPIEWDRYESRIEAPTNRILDLLDKYETKAIFFVLGWVADKYPELINSIHKRGHLIGSHGYHHRLVYKMTEEEFEVDLIRSLKSIANITGVYPRLFRAPGFSIGQKQQWAFDVLIRNGIILDASVFSPSRSHGGFGLNHNSKFQINRNKGSLVELPMSFVDLGLFKLVLHGGGYFRLFPYWILNFLWRKEYNMIYLHPRDFDPNQEVLPDLGKFRTFKTYVGLSSTEGKLEKLLISKEFTLPQL